MCNARAARTWSPPRAWAAAGGMRQEQAVGTVRALWLLASVASVWPAVAAWRRRGACGVATHPAQSRSRGWCCTPCVRQYTMCMMYTCLSSRAGVSPCCHPLCVPPSCVFVPLQVEYGVQQQGYVAGRGLEGPCRCRRGGCIRPQPAAAGGKRSISRQEGACTSTLTRGLRGWGTSQLLAVADDAATCNHNRCALTHTTL